MRKTATLFALTLACATFSLAATPNAPTDNQITLTMGTAAHGHAGVSFS